MIYTVNIITNSDFILSIFILVSSGGKDFSTHTGATPKNNYMSHVSHSKNKLTLHPYTKLVTVNEDQ